VIDSENVIYSWSHGKGGGCLVCGREVSIVFDVRHACSRSHKNAAGHIRAGKYGGRRLVEGPDVCRVCGKATPAQRRTPRLCGRVECREAYAMRGWQAFRGCVRAPHPLGWLGPKLGLAKDDPRLAEIALALALKGRLVVYVRADGSVGEVGRPREEPAA
jgi:hypothetical protein